jgi:hypothetical protein
MTTDQTEQIACIEPKYRLKLLSETLREPNLETQLLFIDYEKAFFSIQRQILFDILKSIINILLQSALQPLDGFRPAQLSLIIPSRKVLESAVASGTSNSQLGGEPGI